MIRAVVVDDSALARKLVSQMLESDPAITVVIIEPPAAASRAE